MAKAVARDAYAKAAAAILAKVGEGPWSAQEIATMLEAQQIDPAHFLTSAGSIRNAHFEKARTELLRATLYAMLRRTKRVGPN